jgi:hypothetical protein
LAKFAINNGFKLHYKKPLLADKVDNVSEEMSELVQYEIVFGKCIASLLLEIRTRKFGTW